MMMISERLGNLVHIQGGGTPARSETSYWNGNIPWATVKDFTGIKIDSTKENITQEGLESCAANLIPAGHVLTPTRMGLGRAAINTVPMAINQDIKALKCNKRLYPRYLLRYLIYRAPFIASLGTGATVKGISLSQLKSLEVPLPSISDQRQIVTILDKADIIRRKRREAISQTDKLLYSVFSSMFSKYINSDRDSRFGEMLKEPLINGFFAKNEEYGEGSPVVWVDNLYHTISIVTEGLRRAYLSDQDISRYEVREGDLLFTRSSLVAEGIGQINIVPSLSERTAFECHIIRARVDTKKLNPYYVLGLYRSSFGRKNILRNANTATMTTINQRAIECLPCPVPPLELQSQFERIVRQTEFARSALERALIMDEQLMGCLTQRAFKGEI